MTLSRPMTYIKNSRSEAGFSLFAVLIAVMALGGVVSSLALYNSGQSRVSQAKSAGWNLVQVSRAARLYVRNNSIAIPPGVDQNGDGTLDDTFTKPVLSAGPQEIPVADLVTAGLLPAAFPDRNVLDQRIRVFAANYPLDGDPALPSTAATAYVYLEPSSLSSAMMMQVLAGAARENGLPVVAPTLDAAGNPSEDCQADGQPDVALWDTGCLNGTQFTALTGAVFTPGALLAPAWRSMTHDPRALMRYEQAENPEAARMSTNLAMGIPDIDGTGVCENEIIVSEPNANGISYSDRSTGLCDVLPDQPGLPTVTEADRRVDILNVSTITADRVVARPQGAAEVRRVIDPVTGDLTLDTAGDDVASGLSTDIDGTHLETIAVAGTFQTRAIRSSGTISGSNYDVIFMRPDGLTPGDLTVSENVYARNLSGNDMPTVVARANFFAKKLKTDGLKSDVGETGIGVINQLTIEEESKFDDGVTIEAGSFTTTNTLNVKNANIDFAQTGDLEGSEFQVTTFEVAPTALPSGATPDTWVDPVKIDRVFTAEIIAPNFYDPNTLKVDWRTCKGVCPEIKTLDPPVP